MSDVENKCYRQSAKHALQGKIARLRAEADGLEALSKMVPDDERDLPPGAGEALWKLVMGYSSR